VLNILRVTPAVTLVATDKIIGNLLGGFSARDSHPIPPSLFVIDEDTGTRTLNSRLSFESHTIAAGCVANLSSIRRAEDLTGCQVGVRYHSDSHFSAMQALESYVSPDQMNLKFIGSPNDRVSYLLDCRIDAANVFGVQSYIVEQQGFRKVLDTTFMIGFLISGTDVDMADVEKYFRA
jgi:hypothetical protein